MLRGHCSIILWFALWNCGLGDFYDGLDILFGEGMEQGFLASTSPTGLGVTKEAMKLYLVYTLVRCYLGIVIQASKDSVPANTDTETDLHCYRLTMEGDCVFFA